MAKKLFFTSLFVVGSFLIVIPALAQTCPHIYEGINCGANWYCNGCQTTCKTCPGGGDPVGATELNYVSCACSCPSGQIVCSGSCTTAPACGTSTREQNNSSCNGCGACKAGYSPDPTPGHESAPWPCVKAAYMDYANTGYFQVSGNITSTGGDVGGTRLCIGVDCRATWPEAVNAFVDEGNVGFGPTAVLGTNDNIPLSFETNNVGRIYIDTAGNIGIGTTSPSYKLVLSGASPREYIWSTSGNPELDLGDGTNHWGIYRDTGTDQLRFWRTNDRMTITSGGNVGLGTTSPASKLGILGNLAVGAAYAGVVGPGDGAIIQGNVGIGTTAPAYKLDVAGDANVDGHVALSEATVSGNQVLSIEKTAAAGSQTTGIYNRILNNSGVTPANMTGVYSFVSNSDPTGPTGGFVGISAVANHSGTGSMSVAKGIDVRSFTAGTGTISNAYGIQSIADPGTVGTVTNAYGVQGLAGPSTLNSQGIVNTAYGVLGRAGVLYSPTTSASVTTAYGVRGEVQEQSGTVGTGYGGYFSSANATTNYGIYADVFGGTTDWAGYFTGGRGVYTTKLVAGGVFDPGVYEFYLTGQGFALNDADATPAILAENRFNAGIGLYGYATGGGLNYGVYGYTTSSSGRGVHGRASSTAGTNYAVSGTNESPAGTGGWAGYFAGGKGLYTDAAVVGGARSYAGAGTVNATQLCIAEDCRSSWPSGGGGTIGGSGTTNRLAKFTAATTIGDSQIFDNGASVGIGTTSPGATLDVNGVINAATGYRVAGVATAGNYLRGNGTNFVSSTIQSADLPSGSNNYVWLQGGTPGTQQTGNFNVSGTGVLGGNLSVAGYIGAGGLAPSSSYGISARATAAGGYFDDIDSSGSAYVAYGDYGVEASGSSAGVRGLGGSYGVYGTGTNYGLWGSGGSWYGVYGEGGTAGGWFKDSNSSGYAYAGIGDTGLEVGGSSYGVFVDTAPVIPTYGVYSRGSTAGGSFASSGGTGQAYVGYGNYGIYGNGSTAGARFYDSDGAGVGYIGYGDYGGYFTGNLYASGSTTLAGSLTVDTNTLYVDTTNNRVGIGTTSPTNQLHATSRIGVGVSGSSSGAVTFYPPDGTAWFHIDAPGGATGSLRISQGGAPGGTTLMSVLQTGNVGIGTTSPSYKLDVAGDINATGNIKAGSGTNTVYRCATAGALPVGALTINAASCGSTADTGLRVK